MLVFISYPRELEIFAEKLAIALNNRNIDTFRDLDNIRPGEIWNNKIEDNIERADFFVIFYLATVIDNREGFFKIEVDRIVKKCRNNKSLGLITIVFPPTKPEELPIYLATRQNLTARNEERIHPWIYEIIDEVRLKNSTKLKFKWHILLVLMSTLIFFLIIALYNIYNEKEERQNLLKNTENDLKETKLRLLKLPIGESVCNSLRGIYQLDHEYVFSRETDSRSIATHDTTWHTTVENCTFNEKDNFYTLKGIDKTYFDVEAIIDGKYIRIATVLLSYDSEVHIRNSDGMLIDRTFNAVIPPGEVKKNDITIYPNGKFNELAKKLSDDFIYKKTYEVLNNRYRKHQEIKSQGCDPMRGYRGNRIAISFVCPHYTRVMVKKN